jgi:hypothetical protein
VIVTIGFKTPDVLDRALKQVLDLMINSSEEELEIFQDKKYEIQSFLEQYIEHGEFVRLKFDTETETDKVLKKGEY